LQQGIGFEQCENHRVKFLSEKNHPPIQVSKDGVESPLLSKEGLARSRRAHARRRGSGTKVARQKRRLEQHQLLVFPPMSASEEIGRKGALALAAIIASESPVVALGGPVNAVEAPVAAVEGPVRWSTEAEESLATTKRQDYCRDLRTPQITSLLRHCCSEEEMQSLGAPVYKAMLSLRSSIRHLPQDQRLLASYIVTSFIQNYPKRLQTLLYEAAAFDDTVRIPKIGRGKNRRTIPFESLRELFLQRRAELVAKGLALQETVHSAIARYVQEAAAEETNLLERWPWMKDYFQPVWCTSTTFTSVLYTVRDDSAPLPVVAANNSVSQKRARAS